MSVAAGALQKTALYIHAFRNKKVCEFSETAAAGHAAHLPSTAAGAIFESSGRCQAKPGPAVVTCNCCSVKGLRKQEAVSGLDGHACLQTYHL